MNNLYTQLSPEELLIQMKYLVKKRNLTKNVDIVQKEIGDCFDEESKALKALETKKGRKLDDLEIMTECKRVIEERRERQKNKEERQVNDLLTLIDRVSTEIRDKIARGTNVDCEELDFLGGYAAKKVESDEKYRLVLNKYLEIKIEVIRYFDRTAGMQLQEAQR